MFQFRMLVLTLIALTAPAHLLAAGTLEQRIRMSEWPEYVNGPNIAALPQVQKILSGFDENPGNQIIVRYPGGTSGTKWAHTMRDWFISYGVPNEYLKLQAGSGAPDQLLLILITRF
ncbi:MAG: hypothetical protein KTR18_16725 [Acidiferrobacterales bacterium]|nr:hypothetical protein [Acidiferrobacterales bacterium]